MHVNLCFGLTIDIIFNIESDFTFSYYSVLKLLFLIKYFLLLPKLFLGSRLLVWLEYIYLISFCFYLRTNMVSFWLNFCAGIWGRVVVLTRSQQVAAFNNHDPRFKSQTKTKLFFSDLSEKRGVLDLSCWLYRSYRWSF